jgi:uncharacterized membrane protein YebE (DUF533 family)
VNAGRGRSGEDAASTADPSSLPPVEAGATDPAIACVLASKVLYDWLRNRHQLLFPFALDLDRLDAAGAALAIDAMLLAAQADGTFDARERERVEAALQRVSRGAAPAGHAAAALESTKPLGRVLAQVRDVQGAALVYAASLLAIDPGKTVNRLYLRYLAARLQLSDELVESLERRFRATA